MHGPIPATRYTRLAELGRGSFGVVYKASDNVTGRSVAIKVLLKTGDIDARERFAREARILGSIDNQHVVELIEYVPNAPEPYIVMEFCDQGSLRKRVGQPQPWRDVAVVLAHAVNGLEGVHRAGGFHRDIKPDNLLLLKLPNGVIIVKVSDFGVARTPVTTSGPMTRSPWGTPGYMAPELRHGFPFTAASDIYSLGITAIELLTGSVDPTALARATVPQALRNLIASMVDAAPTRRPTAQAIATTLTPLLNPQTAPQPQPRVQVAQPVPPPPTDSSGPGLGTALLVGGGLLALLAALGGGNKSEWDENVGRYRGTDGRFSKR